MIQIEHGILTLKQHLTIIYKQLLWQPRLKHQKLQ